MFSQYLYIKYGHCEQNNCWTWANINKRESKRERNKEKIKDMENFMPSVIRNYTLLSRINTISTQIEHDCVMQVTGETKIVTTAIIL